MAKNAFTNELKALLIELQKNQIEYWQNRAENNFLAGEKDALAIATQLQANYNRTSKEIDKLINAFYGKYAIENKLTLEEAKKILDRNELKDFKSYIDEMLAMGDKENFNPIQMAEFKRLYNKAKITRLEELQAEIDFELCKLTSKNKNKIHNLLYNTYEDSYYKSVYDIQQFFNINKAFSGLNKQAIEKAINTKWLGENYSSRIWKNENQLITTLEQEIPRGITLGYNPKKLASQVSKKLDTNYNNSVRLIRTEYSKILNDATLDGYKASRIDKYKLLVTLDNRTSDICQALDALNETYNVDEAEVGVNYPPFHPNCRTTTIPYFEEDEIDKMTDEELDSISFVTYDDWKNGLVRLEGNKVIYK